MFSEQVARAFLIRSGVPESLADASKGSLVGRPLSSCFFVKAWRDHVPGSVYLDSATEGNCSTANACESSH